MIIYINYLYETLTQQAKRPVNRCLETRRFEAHWKIDLVLRNDQYWKPDYPKQVYIPQISPAGGGCYGEKEAVGGLHPRRGPRPCPRRCRCRCRQADVGRAGVG